MRNHKQIDIDINKYITTIENKDDKNDKDSNFEFQDKEHEEKNNINNEIITNNIKDNNIDKNNNKVDNKKDSSSSFVPEPLKTEFQNGMESLGMYYMDSNDKSNENSSQNKNFLIFNDSNLFKGTSNEINNED